MCLAVQNLALSRERQCLPPHALAAADGEHEVQTLAWLGGFFSKLFESYGSVYQIAKDQTGGLRFVI